MLSIGWLSWASVSFAVSGILFGLRFGPPVLKRSWRGLWISGVGPEGRAIPVPSEHRRDQERCRDPRYYNRGAVVQTPGGDGDHRGDDRKRECARDDRAWRGCGVEAFLLLTMRAVLHGLQCARGMSGPARATHPEVVGKRPTDVCAGERWCRSRCVDKPLGLELHSVALATWRNTWG